MKVTREEVKQGIMLIDLSYPTFLRGREDNQISSLINLWYSIFEETESKVFMEAVKKTLEKVRYLPTIADVKDEIDTIINGNFNPEEIWNNNLPLMMEMRNTNQDDCNWYSECGYQEKLRYFKAWQKLDPSLKRMFVYPSRVVALMYSSDFEFNSFKNEYYKEAKNINKEINETPGLRELIARATKPIEIDTLKQELKTLSFDEMKRLN